jgi:hypothetical protein
MHACGERERKRERASSVRPTEWARMHTRRGDAYSANVGGGVNEEARRKIRLERIEAHEEEHARQRQLQARRHHQIHLARRRHAYSQAHTHKEREREKNGCDEQVSFSTRENKPQRALVPRMASDFWRSVAAPFLLAIMAPVLPLCMGEEKGRVSKFTIKNMSCMSWESIPRGRGLP